MTDITSLENELKEEFETFSIAISRSDVMDKLIQVCRMYRLNAESMVEEWVAFCSTKKLDKKRVTIDMLDHLDRERLSKSSNKPVSKPSTVTSSAARIFTIADYDELLEAQVELQSDVIDAYASPNHKAASKKRQHTPESAVNKRGVGRSPVSFFSPGSQNSPSAFSTPSQKYASRSGQGEVVCSFPTAVDGSLLNNNWREQREMPLSVKMYLERDALVAPYKFMFQKPVDRAYVLNDMIFEMGEKLKEVRMSSEYSHVALPTQAPVTVVGRVCCDGSGRLNAKSLLLEGSLDSSSGRRVSLDVSNVPQFSLFPGQIAAMDGVNISGQRFVANKIHEGVLPSSPVNALRTNGLNVVIAAGPFSTSDNILYEPLNDLVSCLSGDCPPDVCILLGPFVDAKHTILEKGDIGMTYYELFERVVCPLLIPVAVQQNIDLVLVPSHRDLHHLCVYPQPPFLSSHKASKVHWVSDPCTLDIDGVIIGLTSTDILFHLGAEEISGSSKLRRLIVYQGLFSTFLLSRTTILCTRHILMYLSICNTFLYTVSCL